MLIDYIDYKVDQMACINKEALRAAKLLYDAEKNVFKPFAMFFFVNDVDLTVEATLAVPNIIMLESPMGKDLLRRELVHSMVEHWSRTNKLPNAFAMIMEVSMVVVRKPALVDTKTFADWATKNFDRLPKLERLHVTIETLNGKAHSSYETKVETHVDEQGNLVPRLFTKKSLDEVFAKSNVMMDGRFNNILKDIYEHSSKG